MKDNHDTVEVAIRQGRLLAAAPNLTSPHIILASVEALVATATRRGHSEANYYSKSLQACRRFDDSNDLCGVVLKLFGWRRRFPPQLLNFLKIRSMVFVKGMPKLLRVNGRKTLISLCNHIRDLCGLILLIPKITPASNILCLGIATGVLGPLCEEGGGGRPNCHVCGEMGNLMANCLKKK